VAHQSVFFRGHRLERGEKVKGSNFNAISHSVGYEIDQLMASIIQGNKANDVDCTIPLRVD